MRSSLIGIVRVGAIVWVTCLALDTGKVAAQIPPVINKNSRCFTLLSQHDWTGADVHQDLAIPGTVFYLTDGSIFYVRPDGSVWQYFTFPEEEGAKRVQHKVICPPNAPSTAGPPSSPTLPGPTPSPGPGTPSIPTQPLPPTEAGSGPPTAQGAEPGGQPETPIPSASCPDDAMKTQVELVARIDANLKALDAKIKELKEFMAGNRVDLFLLKGMIERYRNDPSHASDLKESVEAHASVEQSLTTNSADLQKAEDDKSMEEYNKRVAEGKIKELKAKACPNTSQEIPQSPKSTEAQTGGDNSHGMLVLPKGLETVSVHVAIDGIVWCTFGAGLAYAVAVKPADDSGIPITSAIPGSPVTIDRPPTLANRLPTARPSFPTDKEPTLTEEPNTSGTPHTSDRPKAPTDTPTTTDVIPPATDTPSSNIPDTVIVKANQVVLMSGQTGTELRDQTVKLTFARPSLPGTGQTKTAQDTGFDRDPPQCTTGTDGQCTLNVHAGDRTLFGLASSPGKPGHYRLDLNLLKHNGAVAETTGKTTPDLKDVTPAGGKLAATEFRIGNRKFTRLAADQPYGKDEDLGPYSRVLGVAVKTDYCRTKKPGPPLGLAPASLSSLNHELPESAAQLQRHVPTQGGR